MEILPLSDRRGYDSCVPFHHYPFIMILLSQNHRFWCGYLFALHIFSETNDGEIEMSKYRRLERLIRINSLIRANLIDSRSGFDKTQEIISCKNNLTGPSGPARGFVEDDQKLVVNG